MFSLKYIFSNPVSKCFLKYITKRFGSEQTSDSRLAFTRLTFSWPDNSLTSGYGVHFGLCHLITSTLVSQLLNHYEKM